MKKLKLDIFELSKLKPKGILHLLQNRAVNVQCNSIYKLFLCYCSSMLEKNLRQLMDCVDDVAMDANRYLNFQRQFQKQKIQKQQFVTKRVCWWIYTVTHTERFKSRLFERKNSMYLTLSKFCRTYRFTLRAIPEIIVWGGVGRHWN